MNKKISLTSILIFALVIIAFNLIFFLVPLKWDTSGSSFWIVYGFSMFIFCLTLVSNIIFFNKNKTKKEKFLGLNALRTSNITFFIQLFVSTLFLILGNFVRVEFWIPLIVEILLITVTVVLLCSKSLYSSYISKHDVEIEINSTFIISVRTELKSLCLKNKIKELKKPLESLYEKSCFIDPVSKDTRNEIDKSILSVLGKLENAIATNSTSRAIELIHDLNVLFIERSEY